MGFWHIWKVYIHFTDNITLILIGLSSLARKLPLAYFHCHQASARGAYVDLVIVWIYEIVVSIAFLHHFHTWWNRQVFTDCLAALSLLHPRHFIWLAMNYLAFPPPLWLHCLNGYMFVQDNSVFLRNPNGITINETNESVGCTYWNMLIVNNLYKALTLQEVHCSYCFHTLGQFVTSISWES